MSDFDMILAVWPKVEANLKDYGGEVLWGLFLEHPESQKYFPKFRDIPQGELQGNAAIAAHGCTVLTKLGELVKAKGNHASVLKPLATTHANQHKIPINMFKLITEVLISVLQKKAGIDKATAEAFRRVMTAVTADIDSYYKELGFAG
ncbi:myoglobin [Brachyhypopomus gauderio]